MGKTGQNQVSDKKLDEITEAAKEVASVAKDERADADCQHESANRQHLSAHKLEKLSDALQDKVAHIRDDKDGDKKPPLRSV